MCQSLLPELRLGPGGNLQLQEELRGAGDKHTTHSPFWLSKESTVSVLESRRQGFSTVLYLNQSKVLSWAYWHIFSAFGRWRQEV